MPRTRFEWDEMLRRWTTRHRAAGRARIHSRRDDRRLRLGPAETLESRALLSAIAVTTYGDVIDAGDGQTSLREAIAEAAATSGADTVVVAAGYYSLSLGQLEIADADGVTIESTGAFIDAHGASRVFHVSAGSDATLRRLRIVGGDSEYDPAVWLSGLGGGILNEGTLTLRSCDVTGNHAAFDGGGVENRFGTLTVIGGGFIASNSAVYGGGGIRNDGGSVSVTGADFVLNDALYGSGVSNFGAGASISLSGVQFRSNTAHENGGGIDNYLGTVAVDHGYFADNFASFGGGGFRNTEGHVTIEESNFASNHATYGGGFSSIGPPASATITGTTFQWNTAGTGGGGIDSYLGTLVVTGGYFYGNSAGFLGGGLFNNQATATVANTEFDFNSADRGGGVFSSGAGTVSDSGFRYNSSYGLGGAGVMVDVGTLTLTRSTLEGNSANAYYGPALGGGLFADRGAVVNVSESDLVGNSGQFGGGLFVGSGSRVSLDRSDLGNNWALYSGGGFFTDGAQLSITDGTLSGNLAYYDRGGAGVAFNGTTSIADSTLERNTAWNGGGVFVEGQASLAIARSTLADNRATNYGGALYVNGGTASVANSDLTRNSVGGAGGGVYAVFQARVGIADCTLSSNSATWGGGALIDGSNLTLNGSTLSDNRASYGGGLYNFFATVSVQDTTLSRNSAYLGGGLFEFGGWTAIDGGTLTENHADGNGGAISAGAGAFVQLNRVTAAANSAGSDGGAVFATDWGTSVSITESTLASNTAGWAGGAVEVTNSAAVSLASSTVAWNTAVMFGGAFLNYYGNLDVFQSTISGNSAGVNAGALGNPGGFSRIIASTVTANTAAANTGGLENPDGFGGTIILWSSIVAGNSSATNPDVYGPLVSWGHNLVGDGTGAFGFDFSDLVGTAAAPIDPKLGALQDNGGPTMTHALLPGSPAIDAGTEFAIAPTDQRGVARPQGLRSDIGAFELEFRTAAVAVKPSGDTGPINLTSKGVTPVAVLSTDTFDATTVDTSNLSLIHLGDSTLAGRVSPLRATLEDVNGDGRLDLVLHFSTQDLTTAGALDGSSLSLVLTGFTTDGKGFIGNAPVKIVGGPARKAGGTLAKSSAPQLAPLAAVRDRSAAAGRASDAPKGLYAPADLPPLTIARQDDLFSESADLLDELLLAG